MTAVTRSLTSAGSAIPVAALAAGLAFALAAVASPRLALFGVAGVLAALLVFRSLIAGLALFIVLTFPDRLPGALGIGSTLAKPLGVLLLLAWALVIVSDRGREVPFLPRDAPVLTFTLLGFLLWSAASTVWAADRSATVHNATRLAQLVALIFVAYSAVRTTRQLGVLLGAFLVGAVATSVYALANGTVHYGRLTGGIFDPNAFAAEMAVAIVVAVFLLVARPRLGVGLLLVAALLPISAAYVQAGSRSGFLALGAALLVAVLIGGSLRGGLVTIVCVIVGLGLAYYAYAAPPQLRARVASIGSGAQADPVRADTWHIALRMAHDYPLAGVGLGNFPAREADYVITTLDVTQVKSLHNFQLVAHNTYLEILAELGLIGALLFGGVVLMTLGRALAVLPALRGPVTSTEVYLRLIIVANVAFLTSAIFVSDQYSKQLWLLFALAVAAARLATQPAPVEERQEIGRGRVRQLPAY